MYLSVSAYAHGLSSDTYDGRMSYLSRMYANVGEISSFIPFLPIDEQNTFHPWCVIYVH